MPPEAPPLPDYERRRNEALYRSLKENLIFRVRRLTDVQGYTPLGEISESERFRKQWAKDKLAPDEIDVIRQALDRFSTLTVDQIRSMSDKKLLEYEGVDEKTVQIYRFLFGQDDG